MDTALKKQLVGTYCVCYNVSYSEVCSLVRNMKSINTIEHLQNYICCAKDCKLCQPDLQKIINYYRKTDT